MQAIFPFYHYKIKQKESSRERGPINSMQFAGAQFLLQWCSIETLRQYISTIEIGYVWAMIMYLKNFIMLFLKINTNKYGIGLSNVLLFINIGQGAAKLWHVKVGGPKKIWPWTHQNHFLLSKRASVKQFSWTSKFDRSLFCSPLTYDDK